MKGRLAYLGFVNASLRLSTHFLRQSIASSDNEMERANVSAARTDQSPLTVTFE